MSIAHGPIDKKLVENALHVFDFDVVAGWLVEW
jgi:hypothetical protein